MPYVLTKIGADSDVLDYAETVNVSSWRSDIAPFVRMCPNPVIDAEVIEACRDFCMRTRLWTKKLSSVDVIAVEASDIAFVAGDPATITSTSTDFTDVLGDGTDLAFEEGMTIVSYNTDDNNRELTLDDVAANTLTLVSGDHLIDESAGDDVIISAADYALESASGDIAEILTAQYDDNIPMTPVSENELNKDDPNWRTKITTDPTQYLMGQDRRIRLVYAPQDELEGGLSIRASMMPLRSATAVQGFLYHDYFEAIKHRAIASILEIVGRPWTNAELSMLHKTIYESKIEEAFNRGHRGYTKASMEISG